MRHLITAVILGAISLGANAQGPKGDASSERQEITNSKPQARAQAKADARGQGKVKQAGGDELKSSVDDSIGNDKAAAAGQAREKARKAKDPTKQPAAAGGTPDMPGAK
jgi:hypothetical protein